MKERFLIESLRLYPNATQDQIAQLCMDLLKNDRKEMLIFADPTEDRQYMGVVLDKYYTEALSDSVTVRRTEKSGDYQVISLTRSSVRAYVGAMLRKLQDCQPEPEIDIDQLFAPETSQGTEPITEMWEELDSVQMPETPEMKLSRFLQENTPLQIENELNAQIIGQPELTKAVADFLYYHALRQLHPDLPQRPLMISGPSGNGKTEVWRAAQRLYGELFTIKIIDGSNISCEGWAGSFKIGNYVDAEMTQGGILVVDEFDKLVKPKHNSKGDNVSMDVQAEFLKLIEGEYRGAKDKKYSPITSKKMGFVMVGAFEALREEKQRRRAVTPRIGFCVEPVKSVEAPVQTSDGFSDEDFICYGIMPEIVGRIATKCSVLELNEKAYMEIIRNPNSRVSQIEKVLKQYGVQITDVISNEELRSLIAASKGNRTGVRWVSAQVESRLLESIRGKGLCMSQAS